MKRYEVFCKTRQEFKKNLEKLKSKHFVISDWTKLEDEKSLWFNPETEEEVVLVRGFRI